MNNEDIIQACLDRLLEAAEIHTKSINDNTKSINILFQLLKQQQEEIDALKREREDRFQGN